MVLVQKDLSPRSGKILKEWSKGSGFIRLWFGWKRSVASVVIRWNFRDEAAHHLRQLFRARDWFKRRVPYGYMSFIDPLHEVPRYGYRWLAMRYNLLVQIGDKNSSKYFWFRLRPELWGTCRRYYH